jgi:NAD-dependent deacetylase
MPTDRSEGSELHQRLEQARRVVVLTGAGVSAESGVPTFRGADGLWRQYRAEDLATPEAFRRDPKLVWEWYDWRRQLIAKCQPNMAHHAIALLERQSPEFLLLTQNVDGGTAWEYLARSLHRGRENNGEPRCAAAVYSPSM